MQHAAAENPQPILAYGEAAFILSFAALDVGFERGFGERKEVRTEAHLHLVDLEERLAELLQNPFQVAEMRTLVDHEPLDLMEHRRVGLIGVDPIGAAWNDDADRWLLAQHGADLHRRSV